MNTSLVAAFALPVLMTAVTLAGVAWNRSRPSAAMVLTEREISLRTGTDDDTRRRFGVEWLTPEGAVGCSQLASAGIPCERNPPADGANEYARRQLPRAVYIVLELDGPAYEAYVRDAERHNAALADQPDEQWRKIDTQHLRNAGSRLVLVDVSGDPDALRERYPDGRRYLVLPAVVRLLVIEDPGDKPYVRGYVDVPILRNLNLPSELAGRLPPAEPRVGSRSPFRLHLQYGRRFEPWVVDASR